MYLQVTLGRAVALLPLTWIILLAHYIGRVASFRRTCSCSRVFFLEMTAGPSSLRTTSTIMVPPTSTIQFAPHVRPVDQADGSFCVILPSLVSKSYEALIVLENVGSSWPLHCSKSLQAESRTNFHTFLLSSSKTAFGGISASQGKPYLSGLAYPEKSIAEVLEKY